jgi:hypothetical protein
MDWLGRLYARRIINVNVNIILAGVAAMLLTLIPVHATRYLGIEDKWVIIGVTLGCDLAFDVAIYYALHWLANHTVATPWSRHREHPINMSYFRDATLVQFERAMLGPVYYGVAVAVQYMLLHVVDREPAALLGLLSGLATTRVLHTLWMLRAERRRVMAHTNALGANLSAMQGTRTAHRGPETTGHSRQALAMGSRERGTRI